MKNKKHLCTVECPHCAGILEVYKETEVITPAQQAQKKITFYTEKSTQKTLDISR